MAVCCCAYPVPRHERAKCAYLVILLNVVRRVVATYVWIRLCIDTVFLHLWCCTYVLCIIVVVALYVSWRRGLVDSNRRRALTQLQYILLAVTILVTLGTVSRANRDAPEQ